MIVAFDYASPSVLDSSRDHAMLGISANARRPVRFHGRATRNLPLLRFTLRALGGAIWSNDIWETQGDLMGGILDPVITVHPDRLFFEAFSQDQSVYAMVVLNPEMFAMEGERVTGTTNVDFTAWLWSALNELRSSRETWLRIGSEGFEIKTKGSGGRFEQKVELPDNWVRGFLQVTGAMAMPGTRLTVRPADLLAAIRFLRYTKAKLSPRAVRYEFTPGEDVRIVLEPWEQVVRLRGAEHSYTEPRIIRTWGRRRLSLIEPLLPFATSVDIYLKGRGLPSFYAVKLPDMTFVLGLSGWSGQSWTDAGSFDLLGGAAEDGGGGTRRAATSSAASSGAGEHEPAPQASSFRPLNAGGVVAARQPPPTQSAGLLSQVHRQLADRFHATPKELAALLGQPPDVIWRACERLCRQGRAIFDVESRSFRHRELFEQPVDEAKMFPPDERMERANALFAKNAVGFARCEPQETRKTRRLKTPDGPVTREIVYRDWRVTGNVATDKTEIVVGDAGRIIFGTCSCAFFQENLLGKGPCEHMIALFKASADGRKDLPTSTAASVVPPAPSKVDSEEAEEEADEEDFDETESDENNEAR